MSGKERIPSESQTFEQKPFAGLSSADLPAGPEAACSPGFSPSLRTPNSDASSDGLKPGLQAPQKQQRKSRGRVDIIRQTAHRGGKTVTVVANFIGIGLPEKEKLAKQMQKACGTGGTVKDGRIEIQGDKRNEVAKILSEAGFRPVFAGG